MEGTLFSIRISEHAFGGIHMTHARKFYREIYDRYKASSKAKEDIHTKLMKNYKDIPAWWFYILLTVTMVVSLILCIFLKHEIQMPVWALLFAAALAFTFTLPISIITATTNQVTSSSTIYTSDVLSYWEIRGNFC